MAGPIYYSNVMERKEKRKKEEWGRSAWLVAVKFRWRKYKFFRIANELVDFGSILGSVKEYLINIGQPFPLVSCCLESSSKDLSYILTSFVWIIYNYRQQQQRWNTNYKAVVSLIVFAAGEIENLLFERSCSLRSRLWSYPTAYVYGCTLCAIYVYLCIYDVRYCACCGMLAINFRKATSSVLAKCKVFPFFFYYFVQYL